MLRLLLSALFAVACGYLLGSALDMPMQTLDENTLVTLYATEALLLLAAIALLLRRRGSGIHAADLLAAALFAWIWFRHAIVSEPTVDIRYDELAQSAMLYIALRILLSSDRYYTALLLTLLFLFGIHEAWIGFRQVYGLTYSNHGMFRITGTLFNPGPYAGFLAPLSLCAAAWIICVCAKRLHAFCDRVVYGCAPISCYAAPFLMHSAGGAPSRRPSYFPPR